MSTPPGPGGDDLRYRAPATAEAATTLRHRLSVWAARAGLPDQVRADLLLAAYEAVVNVVEHAYPVDEVGEFELHAIREHTGHLVVTVSDHGRWRPPPPDPGARGRGLVLISVLASTEISTGPAGTTVVMTWVPPGDMPSAVS